MLQVHAGMLWGPGLDLDQDPGEAAGPWLVQDLDLNPAQDLDQI